MPYFSEARERAKMEKWMQNWTCQRTLGQMKVGKLMSMGNIVQLFVVVFSSRASFSIIFCFQETVAVAMCLAALNFTTVTAKEGPMPGDSAETLDDLRQECAVLRQRVVPWLIG